MKIGPVATEQLERFGREWKQGEHVLVSGGTGSGKTTLARQIIEQRIKRHGFVVVFVSKIRPDNTILEEYKGWVRWKTWKRTPGVHENRVLLWPDTKGMNTRDALEHQHNVFRHALDMILRSGKWAVQIDEGLTMTSPSYLKLAPEVGMLHNVGRSSGITLLTLVQRPSHIPLVIYSNISHAFIGRTRERTDLKRLAELDGAESSNELSSKIKSQGRNDFLWIPIAPDWPSETVNLKR
jgi:energy-coupling factor transporter ATP-binding protein EcfA2